MRLITTTFLSAFVLTNVCADIEFGRFNSNLEVLKSNSEKYEGLTEGIKLQRKRRLDAIPIELDSKDKSKKKPNIPNKMSSLPSDLVHDGSLLENVDIETVFGEFRLLDMSMSMAAPNNPDSISNPHIGVHNKVPSASPSLIPTLYLEEKNITRTFNVPLVYLLGMSEDSGVDAKAIFHGSNNNTIAEDLKNAIETVLESSGISHQGQGRERILLEAVISMTGVSHAEMNDVDCPSESFAASCILVESIVAIVVDGNQEESFDQGQANEAVQNPLKESMNPGAQTPFVDLVGNEDILKAHYVNKTHEKTNSSMNDNPSSHPSMAPSASGSKNNFKSTTISSTDSLNKNKQTDEISSSRMDGKGIVAAMVGGTLLIVFGMLIFHRRRRRSGDQNINEQLVGIKRRPVMSHSLPSMRLRRIDLGDAKDDDWDNWNPLV